MCVCMVFVLLDCFEDCWGMFVCGVYYLCLLINVIRGRVRDFVLVMVKECWVDRFYGISVGYYEFFGLGVLVFCLFLV